MINNETPPGYYHFEGHGQLNPYDKKRFITKIANSENIEAVLNEACSLLSEKLETSEDHESVGMILDLLDYLKTNLKDVDKESLDPVFAAYRDSIDISLSDAKYQAEYDLPLLRLLKVSGFDKEALIAALTTVEHGATPTEQKNAASLRTLIISLYE